MENQDQPESTPAWAQALFQQMHQAMADQAAQIQSLQQQVLDARTNSLRPEVQGRLSPEPLPSITPVTDTDPQGLGRPEVVRSDVVRKKRSTLPDPPKFNGQRSGFRAWLLEMRSKLRVDGEAIGSPQDQFSYVFARLDRTPQNMTIAYVEKGGNNASYDPQDFLAYLDQCYGDPNSQRRAIDRLRAIRQKEGESFASFLPKFERELADSGGGDWAELVQINYLEGALSDTLKDRLVNVTETPTDYQGFVRVLQTIGSRLDSLSYRRRQHEPEKREPPQESAMDWEPTKTTLASSRAKDSLTRKGKEGRACFECRRVGHLARDCPESNSESDARKEP